MAEAAVVKAAFAAVKWTAAFIGKNAIAKAAFKAAVAFGVSQVVRNNTKPESNGTLIALAISPDEPRRLLIGKRATGGIMVDWFARGTRSQNIYVPIYLSDGPCGSISRIWAGGREVYSTAIRHEERHAQPEFNEDGDRLWVTYHDGRDGQSADSSLRTYFPSQVAATDVGEGCAYVLVEYQWDDENMLSPVDLTFELEGTKFYDLRKDTSAGGSGLHRLDDRTTWEFSDNPAVVLYHYLRGIYQNDVLTWGVGLSTDEVPFDRFVALANLCDETVSLSGGGTQARYAFNGFLFADHAHDVNINKLCRAMNCEPADFMGRIGVIDRQSKTPVLTIDDADVIESEPSSYTPKRSRSELVTAVEGRFADPSAIYNETDYPRIAEASWLAEDGGEARTVTYALEDHETDAERAQRLAWLYGMNERRQAILTERYPRWAIELEQGDWFTRTGDKFGAGKTFEVINAAFDPSDFTVLVVAREVDPTDSAWTTDIPNPAPTQPTPNTDTLPSGKTAPSVTWTPTTISGADGTKFPAVVVTHSDAATEPVPRDLFIQIARDDGEGAPVSGGELISSVLEGTETAVIVQLPLAETDYVGRVKFVRGERRSNWSSWTEFTTPAGLTIPVDWDTVTNKPDGITYDPVNESSVGYYPGFRVVGTIGDIEIVPNAITYSDIQVTEGYIDHRLLNEKVDVETTYFTTAWGSAFAPKNGWFVLVWSEEATSTRFTNRAGSKNIFPATYDDGQWYAWKGDRENGETFTPRDTDVIIARCIKAVADEETLQAVTANITEVISYIIPTGELTRNVEEIKEVVGDPDDEDGISIFARIFELNTVFASEKLATAEKFIVIEAGLDDANSRASQALTAISTLESAFAAYQISVTAELASKASKSRVDLLADSVATVDTAFSQFAASTSASLESVASQASLALANIATLDESQAEFVVDINSAVGSLTSRVNIQAGTLAALDGKISSFYGTSLTSGGLTGGFGIWNDGETVRAVVDADAFLIRTANGQKTVFKTNPDGSVEIEDLIVQNLRVGTDQIKPKSTYDGVSENDFPDVAVNGSGSYQTLKTLSYAAKGGRLRVDFNVRFRVNPSGAPNVRLFARVLRNGQDFGNEQELTAFSPSNPTLTGFAIAETIATGNATYTLQVKVLSGASGVSGCDASRFSLEIEERIV